MLLSVLCILLAAAIEMSNEEKVNIQMRSGEIISTLSNGEEASTSMPTSKKVSTEISSTEEVNTGMPIKKEISTEMPIKREVSTGMPVKKEDSIGMPIREEISTEMPIKKEVSTVMPIKKEVSTGMPIKKEVSVGMPIMEEVSTGMPIKKEVGVGMPITEEVSTGTSNKKEINTGTPIGEEVSTGLPIRAEVSTGMPTKKEGSTGKSSGEEISTVMTFRDEVSTGMPIKKEVSRQMTIKAEVSTGMPTKKEESTEMPTGEETNNRKAAQNPPLGVNTIISGRSEGGKQRCVVPKPPPHGNYTSVYLKRCSGRSSIFTTCWAQPGRLYIHNGVMRVFCDPGYQLQDYTSEYALVRCNDGRWTQDLPKCERNSIAGMCGRLVSFSVDITCRLAGREVSCKNFVPAGTIATVKCREHFTSSQGSEHSTLQCQDNGQWNQTLLECDPPKCGVPLSPAAYGSPGLQQRGYPWTAYIYLDWGERYQDLLGTLITPKVVLTDPYLLMSKRNKRVIVYLRLSDNDFKAFQVQEIVVHPNYTDKLLYQNQLALVVLAQPVEVSALIMPACIDWANSLSLEVDNTGYTVGWNNSIYHTLQSYEVAFKNTASCKLDLETNSIEDDAFCVHDARGYKICNGSDCFEWNGPRNGKEFGSGLTVLNNGKHFIVGTMTLRWQRKKVDLYTTVTYPKHMEWLREQVDAARDCVVPDLNNRVFAKHNCQLNTSSCSVTTGDLVNRGALIAVTCRPGTFMVLGVDTVVVSACRAGNWVPKLPQCNKLCPALTASTLDLRCWFGTPLSNCDQPMLPNSIATYSCKAYNDNSGRRQTNRVRCNSDGTWSGDPLNCTAQCGISNLDPNDVQPAILGGSFAKPGNVPWHVAVYLRTEGVWENKCGGTLVSTRHVLTAAHCVTSHSYSGKPPPQPLADVMVGLGRYYRQWNSSEGMTREIQRIHVHPNYFGHSLNLPHDIAVLVLESDVAVDRFVMPACVDYSYRYLQQLIYNNTLQGYVAGWGNTEECSSLGHVCYTPSDKLKLTSTTIVGLDQCFTETQGKRPGFPSKLTLDKFCAGDGSVSVIQQGDSGGGMTFVFDGLHYIYGVVSVKLKLEQQDRLYYNFGGFTNVSYHLDWLNSIL